MVCPWCFIGKRRLEKALETFLHRNQVTIRHRAFQLQPDIKEVVLISEYLANKYQASPQQVEEMQANVCLVADLLTSHLYFDEVISEQNLASQFGATGVLFLYLI